MAKNSIADYSATAASNTDIQSVDIDEGCAPSGINNAIRELMADLADVDAGTVALTSPNFTAFSVGGTAVTATAAELNYVDGVTSNIQTQLDAKGTVSSLSDLSITATATELNYNDITTLGTSQASKVVTADANGDVLFSADVTFDGKIVEESNAITSSGGAATIDLDTGTNFTHTLSEDVTYTFSNPAASGRASSFSLKITQDSTARTITWPSSVAWRLSTSPTLSTTSGAVDVFVFVTYDGGTTYYGFTAGQAMG